MADGTVVLDLGAFCNKIGIHVEEEPRIIPNCISKAKNERRKVFYGDQLSECKDFSGLFYVLPFQRGYLVNWDVQRQLFDYMFNKETLKGEPLEKDIVITEPQFNFTSIKECLDEILFEEYQFKSVCRITAAQLAEMKRKSEDDTNLCCLVVDSGFSFTHIVPICEGKIVKSAVRRVDVGGKILTNHLKEIISYRQLHVLDETYVMNQVKEDCCYVSNNFHHDMEITRLKKKLNTISREYILPDYTNVKRGFIRPLEEMWTKYNGTEQLLKMNNERFTVPELLFHPSDIGVEQAGISEAIVDSISSLPVLQQPHLYKNIVLTGGNSLFEGYKKRIYSDVRSMAPDDFDVNIHLPDNAMTYSWKGGMELSKHGDFKTNYSVSKSEYEESGRTLCAQRFEHGVP